MAYLRSVWAQDFKEFQDSPKSQEIHTRLKYWAGKDWQRESASSSTFLDLFFKRTWGYSASGESHSDDGYTLYPEYPVKGAGQKGGTGKADVALGFFGRDDMQEIPQVLAEFKDDRSGLDKPQANRPNDRSPVDQCIDYLRESRTGFSSAPMPTWAIVTDMNEFRLYAYGTKDRYQRFIIDPPDGAMAVGLLDDTEDAEFQRFLFQRLLHIDWLLNPTGVSRLEKLRHEQLHHEQALENEFYLEYQAFRESIYQALRENNPQYEENGSLRRLVKLTQRILDRCIFILYCEDMGQALEYPPNVLRDVLARVAEDPYYDPEGLDAWTKVKQLFVAMRDGTPFGSHRINEFNGGLFEEDSELDALKIPNVIFCEKNQHQSERLVQFPKTLLYFSAKYNFGASGTTNERALTLTAMGRIFEQSITELEVMEAHAEGRKSIAEITKRKRDGVYYTPEWVTHYIVEETIGARLAEIREELGFSQFEGLTEDEILAHSGDRRTKIGKYEKALHQYRDRLDNLKVVDPACGSGAFLIQAFKYLYEQREWIANELERVTGETGLFDTHAAMRAILSNNLYGVDINAESVEITRLALWLHTALPDRPLTSLDENIRCGNSLVGHDFYSQMEINPAALGEDDRERINTFDWKEAFADVL